MGNSKNMIEEAISGLELRGVNCPVRTEQKFEGITSTCNICTYPWDPF